MSGAYGWVAAAGLWTSVFLFVAAAVKFMADEPEEARRFLLAGLVALFIAAAGPATLEWLVGGIRVQAATASLVVAVPPPSKVAEEFPAEAWFVHTGLINTSVCVGVDWGDGHVSTKRLAPGGAVNLTHNYGYGSCPPSHPCRVRLYSWSGGCGSIPGNAHLLAETSVVAVSVGEQVKQLLINASEEMSHQDTGSWIGNRIRDALAILLKVLGYALGFAVEVVAKLMEVTGANPGAAAYWLLALPDASMPGLQQLWARASAWMPLLWPMAALAGALWRVFRDPRGLELYEYASDMVLSLIVALAGLALYAPLARLYNAMVLSIAQLNQFNTVYSILLGHIVLGSVLGFNSFAAAVAWTAFIAILGIVVIGILKWLAAGAVVGLAPIWSALWLFPPLRRAAEAAADLLVKMAVLGLVAAGMMFLASMAPLLGVGRGAVNLVVAYALPIVVPLGGHYILGQLGLGGLPGVGALRALRTARAVPQAAAGAAATTALAAATGGAALAAAPAATTIAGGAAAPTAATTAATGPLGAARQLAAQGLALQLRKKWLQPKPIAPAPAPAKAVEAARRAAAAARAVPARAREAVRAVRQEPGMVARRAGELAARAAAYAPALLEQRIRNFTYEFLAAAERDLGITLPKPQPWSRQETKQAAQKYYEAMLAVKNKVSDIITRKWLERRIGPVPEYRLKDA